MASPKFAASTEDCELLPRRLVPGVRTTTGHIQSATCRMTSEVPTTAATGQPRQPGASSSSFRTVRDISYGARVRVSLNAVHLYHQLVKTLFHKAQCFAPWGRPSGFVDVLNSL